jgi:hypothetical protein
MNSRQTTCSLQSHDVFPSLNQREPQSISPVLETVLTASVVAVMPLSKSHAD